MSSLGNAHRRKRQLSSKQREEEENRIRQRWGGEKQTKRQMFCANSTRSSSVRSIRLIKENFGLKILFLPRFINQRQTFEWKWHLWVGEPAQKSWVIFCKGHISFHLDTNGNPRLRMSFLLHTWEGEKWSTKFEPCLDVSSECVVIWAHKRESHFYVLGSCHCKWYAF